ncbi:MAG: type II/IV secretion system ATPase subunit [Candidatus Thermoplasmatota archaeon]|nr:type II/IV secretion system ATPase subunit [Candidatus Thermoplasmatota archaeon]
MGGGRSRPRIIGQAPSAIPLRIVNEPYREKQGDIFHTGPASETRPCFTSSWIEVRGDMGLPKARFSVRDVNVSLFALENETFGRYIVDPPEYRLNPIHLRMISDTIEIISASPPTEMDTSSLDLMRPYIKSRAKDIVFDKLVNKGRSQPHEYDDEKMTDNLAEIVAKYTAGYGLLESLLDDPQVQDIYVNAPSSVTPVFVVLRSDTIEGVRQKCRTNIFIGARDVQGFVSRLKLETGLPFSEAHPVLEADIPRLGSRVTLVGPPISEKGVSVAIRKHSREMWTLPRLIRNDSLSPLLASFLWACVTGRRTALVAGSRGAGKTTLLAAMMLEFPLSQRILLIEDTPEIPVRRMRDLGYDIQTLRFTNDQEVTHMSAEGALMVSLRMGESAIVIGEVRGSEARVLYESMRAGSAGSAVLGTIHGNSASGVLDRAVEDLGVSERAFSATDIVIVIGLVRTPDGSRFHRKVVEVAEVKPKDDGVELVNLFEMGKGSTSAEPTKAFSTESRTVKGAAAAMGITAEALIGIIKTRAICDQLLSERSDRMSNSCIGAHDSVRLQSNELLASALFHPDGPTSGLDRWRELYGETGTI